MSNVYIYYNVDTLRILNLYSVESESSHIDSYPYFLTTGSIGLIKKPIEISEEYPKLFIKNGQIYITNDFGYDPYRWEHGCREDQINEFGLQEKRTKRNKLLAECDWTQVNDIVLANDREWKLYRQALRDITKVSDITEIRWPVRPDNTLSQETQPEIEVTEFIDTQNVKEEFLRCYDITTGRKLRQEGIK